MQYFETDKLTRSALCSDPECPCNEVRIAVGQGYLYIPESCCDFRWDCRTQAQLLKKLERAEKQSGRLLMLGHGLAGPILVCEEGARKRDLDLAVASRDAQHWWATGKVPFRPSPRAGEAERPYIKIGPGGVAEEEPGAVWLSFGALVVIGLALWWYIG